MLENAKVNLDLEDFDKLRNDSTEVRTIKALIAFAVDTEITKENEDVQGVNLTVNLDVIEKLVRQYHAFGKSNNEWIDESLDKEDIVVKFEDTLQFPKRVLKFEEESHTSICPSCGILVDMDRDIYCYKCGQKLER